MDVILFIHLLELGFHQVLFFIHYFHNPLSRIHCGIESTQDSLIITIIWLNLRLNITQGSSKSPAFPNRLEICWTFLLHVSKTLTSEALWFKGNSILTAILSILLSFVLNFELRRIGLLMVLFKTFHIGILHILIDLPSDVGLHLGIFIIQRLTSLISFGIQCHILTFGSFPKSS